MSELVLPAALFSDEPVECEIEVYNGYTFKILLRPADGDTDVEYLKRRGHDQQTLKFKPKKSEGDGDPQFEFEPVERVFSNEKEVAANRWLAKKIIAGFPEPLKLSNGTILEDPMKHLNELAAIPWFFQPILKKSYDLGKIESEIEEGN